MEYMTIYGAGRERPKKEKIVDSDEIVRPALDPDSPYIELCKFAQEFRLNVELDKPFVEFDEMKLNIKEDGELVKSVTLDSIDALDDISAAILNELGQKYK